MTSPNSRHAHVVGLGLIGASVALALKEHGWSVTRRRQRRRRRSRRRSTAASITGDGLDPRRRLGRRRHAGGRRRASRRRGAGATARIPTSIVTDVAGRQGIDRGPRRRRTLPRGAPHGRIGAARTLRRARRPLPGSDLGPHADRPDVTRPPTARCTASCARSGRTSSRSAPTDHDRLVAIASHVPHLLAGSLMNEASQVAEQDAVLLQLAAGGFRDMTRIAAGDPGDLARHPLRESRRRRPEPRGARGTPQDTARGAARRRARRHPGESPERRERSTTVARSCTQHRGPGLSARQGQRRTGRAWRA